MPAGTAWAQGTTASMTGRVVTVGGEMLPGVNVVATHQPTGTKYGSATNANGRFTILNMRVGGPYTVRASFVGYETVTRTGITLQLGEKQTVNFELQEATAELEGVTVTAEQGQVINENRMGAATNISEAQIDELPTIDRSLQDFARLTPQYGGGGSFGGANDRYNSIQIDGATLDDVFGLGEAVPGSQAGTQPISLDAIKEFNIDLAPFDVRNSGFTGGMINAITKSGTNEFTGSLRYMTRSEQFTGDLNGIGTGTYSERYIVGTLGGPIIEDELFFFVSGEIVRQDNPLNATVGGGGINSFQLSDNLLNQFGYPDTRAVLSDIADITQNVYNYNPGGISPLTQEQNSNKVLAKLDWNINPNHRLTLRHNYVKGTDDQGVGRGQTNFSFGNGGYTFESVQNSTVLQLNSNFGTQWFNEFRAVYTRIRDERALDGGGFPAAEVEFSADREVNVGVGRFSQANRLDQDLLEVTNNLGYTIGNHTLTFGTSNKMWHFENLFIQDYFGSYEFNALEFPNGEVVSPVTAYRNGQPIEYFYSYATEAADSNKPIASFTAFQAGAYVQDEWQALENLQVTAGLRVDVPIIPDDPTFNPTAFEAFGRSTANVASGNPLFSPRVGFNYSNEFIGDLSTQVRGGAGLFAGNPPFVWVSNQYSNTGADFNRLDADFSFINYTMDPQACADAEEQETSPACRYNPDARFVPTTSGTEPANQPKPGGNNQLSPIATTEINLMSDDFKYPQVLRTNFAIDQELPGDFVLTLEGLYSNTMSDIVVRNLNAQQVNPNAADAPYGLSASKYGRPIYGIPTTSVVNRLSPQFTNALLLENTSRGYSYSATVQVQRRVAQGLNGSIAYTYTDNESVNSGSSSRAISNWQYNETFDVNNPQLGNSDYLVKHRIIGDLTYRFQYADRFATSVGLVYEGRIGYPFSWVYNGNANGDTRDDNDLVYVPANQNDIVLTTNNWEQMNAFIESQSGLNEYRGTFAERNSDFAPWTHKIDLQFSQTVRTFAGQKVEIEATLENALNALNDDWGRVQTVSFNNEFAWGFEGYVTPDDVGTRMGGRILTQDDVGKPVVAFQEDVVYDKITGDLFNLFDIASRWQLQLGVKYTF